MSTMIIDDFILATNMLYRGPTTMVHRFHPDGLDALHYHRARKDIEALAKKLTEPVCLSFHSAYLSSPDNPVTVHQVFYPNTQEASDRSIWLYPYSKHPNRYVSDHDFNASILLSGASADNRSIDIVDVNFGGNVAEATERLASLYRKARVNVYMVGNEKKIHSGAEEVMGQDPRRPDRNSRNAVAAQLNKFWGYEAAIA